MAKRSLQNIPERKMKKLMTRRPPWIGLEITMEHNVPAALPSLFIILFNIVSFRWPWLRSRPQGRLVSRSYDFLKVKRLVECNLSLQMMVLQNFQVSKIQYSASRFESFLSW